MTEHEDFYDLIRLLARGDYHGYRQRCELLDATGWHGLGLVVGATFFRAVERRFAARPDRAGVIRLVAEARADLDGTGFDMDPLDGETLVTAAMTGDAHDADAIDGNKVVEIEMFLLREMLKLMPDNEMTSLFQEADTLVDQWTS